MTKVWHLRLPQKYATSPTKVAAPKTLVRPDFVYADVVRDPYTSRNTSNLEEIQNEVLRIYITNTRERFLLVLCVPKPVLPPVKSQED